MTDASADCALSVTQCGRHAASGVTGPARRGRGTTAAGG